MRHFGTPLQIPLRLLLVLRAGAVAIVGALGMLLFYYLRAVAISEPGPYSDVGVAICDVGFGISVLTVAVSSLCLAVSVWFLGVAKEPRRTNQVPGKSRATGHVRDHPHRAFMRKNE